MNQLGVIPKGRLQVREDVSDSQFVAVPNSGDYQYAYVTCQAGVFARTVPTPASGPPSTPSSSDSGFLCPQQQTTGLEIGGDVLFVRAVSGSNRVVSVFLVNDEVD